MEPSSDANPIPLMAARRIVVADDNHDSADVLATLLGLHGHDVRVAHDGIEVLAIADTFKPHVVLLDLGMPKMDGYETARQTRQRPWGKDAMLVALTGWGQQQDRQRTAEAGFDAHLVKPVTDSDLFHLLATTKVSEG
jgi:CheY-like chemotaxis protein